MSTDAELLQRYAGQHDERAFAELVQRHLGFVYATAHRSIGGRAHLAEEIAQKVFTQLARKAASLRHHPTLTGWLYRSARYASLEVSRAELRRQRVNESLATMPDTTSASDAPADWDQLRPVLDEALEGLKEQDRDIMLLRFFQGLTFAEVGEKLGLSENAARMRTERALDKLRGHLGKRGVTSTTAALGLLLANQAFAHAPTGLATSVTATALAAAPAGVSTAIVTSLLLNKIALTGLTAVLAAGLTTVAWITWVEDPSGAELAGLQTENTRLLQANTVGASSAAVVADAYAAQANTIVQAAGKRLSARKIAGTGTYRDHGQATPKNAARTLAWAIDTGDVGILTPILAFDEKGLETLRGIHAGLPASIRSQYRTPEELMAFFYLANTLLNPVPGEDMWEKMVVDSIETELAAGRVVLRQPKQTKGGLYFVQTAGGWRLEIPGDVVARVSTRVLSNEMLAKLGAL